MVISNMDLMDILLFGGMRKTERLIGTDMPLRGLKRGLSVNGC